MINIKLIFKAKEILNKINAIIDAYYKINNAFINNYDKNKINYNELQNLNNLKNNNEKLIKDLDRSIKIIVLKYINFYLMIFMRIMKKNI